MLTVQMLQDMPPETVFASGTIENSPDGLFMVNNNIGKSLMWAAKRGRIHDWAIYCYWANSGLDFVLSNGDKIINESNIKKLVPCDSEALKMYRK